MEKLMNKFLTLAMFFIPAMLCADTHIFYQIIEKAEKLYLQGDNRGNKILSDITLEDSLAQRFPKSHPRIIESMTHAHVAAEFKTCVFFAEGSYSEHLSDEQAENLSREMAQYILSMENIKLYRIEKTNIFSEDGQTPPCALGFGSDNSKGILLMQGFYETP